MEFEGYESIPVYDEDGNLSYYQYTMIFKED